MKSDQVVQMLNELLESGKDSFKEFLQSEINVEGIQDHPFLIVRQHSKLKGDLESPDSKMIRTDYITPLDLLTGVIRMDEVDKELRIETTDTGRHIVVMKKITNMGEAML